MARDPIRHRARVVLNWHAEREGPGFGTSRSMKLTAPIVLASDIELGTRV
jgi:hypothetical protein